MFYSELGATVVYALLFGDGPPKKGEEISWASGLIVAALIGWVLGQAFGD